MMKSAVIPVTGMMRMMVVIHGSMQEGEDKTEDKRTATVVSIIMGEIIVVVVAKVALITILVEQIRLINLKQDIDFLAGRFDGRKIRSNFLRSIFNPAHHFYCLCLDLLAVRTAFVRKLCGGKFGWLILVDSSPKLIVGTSMYVKYSRVPSQLTCCAHKSTSRYSTLGIPTFTMPPRP